MEDDGGDVENQYYKAKGKPSPAHFLAYRQLSRRTIPKAP